MGLAMLWLIKANTKVFLAPSVTLDMEGIFFTSNFERVGKLIASTHKFHQKLPWTTNIGPT